MLYCPKSSNERALMSTQPQSSVSPARVAAIQEAVSHWERQLVDNTAGSPLLVYRHLKAGTLDLTPADDREISRSVLNTLLGGRSIRLSGLFPTDPDADETEELDDARKRLTLIARKAQTYREEKGTDTLFLAAGLATWEREGSGRPPNAPVILLPLSATPEGAAHREFMLELAGDASFNPVLRQEFRTAYGMELSDDSLESLPASYPGIDQFLQELEKSWAKVPGFRIEPRLVVRDFHYTNMPLVDDLKNNAEAFAASDVVAAIAGVEEARNSLNLGIDDPPPDKPDADPPESEFLILDADSSQHRAINRALAGQSVVIWGPPGTGKSQTIANLIAALIAQSKRVLFVAQKQAAVEVVANRLHRVELSDLVMDCHGGIKSKREFARSLADSIQRIGMIPAQDYSRFYQELSDCKQSLLSYADTLHRLREPWQISAFAAQVALIDRPAAVAGIRLQSDKALGLSRAAVTRLKSDVQRWIDLEGPHLATRYPEWANAPVVKAQDARSALELAQGLAGSRLPRCRSLWAEAAKETGLTIPEAPVDWPALLKLLAEVKELSERFKPGIYALDHLPLVTALRPRESLLSRWGANLSGSYRSAKSAVTAELRSPGKLSGDAAYYAVEKAAEQVHQWQGYQPAATPIPVAPENLTDLQAAVAALLADLETLERLTGNRDWRQRPAAQLAALAERMGNQQDLAARLPQIRELEREFQAAGIAPVIAAIGNGISVAAAPEAVEHCWFKAVWDEMVFADRQLAGFVGDTHNRNREDFATYDRQHLEHSPERIKRVAAERAIDTMNQFGRELDLVKREGAKRSRHLSVRELFRQTPNLLTALRPCWMMSPLQVAELVPVGGNLFDVVIFDEASQIPPAEAIGSLARAPQFIVAGDERQLPPTNFFARTAYDGEEIEEDEDGTRVALTADIESVLDAVKALPVREQMLQWHYRSRDGRLIAFSNTHIYGDALTAFPGTALETPLVFHPMDLSIVASRSTVSHPEEVEKVVDLVIDHAGNNPEESLGVIAFGIRHANNIEEALRRRLNEVKDPSLDAFFAEGAAEKFFVKNIERVQGDERDVIILSVGYHKADNGNLPYRFGPLNQVGGERRLNVAITRARSRMHLVCAFSHHDMEPGRSNARGVELLRQYLEFAASGGAELGGALSGESLNPFELDVLNRLTARGIPATPQYGVAGYRIDFACAHPEQPGRMVLAIEADGASYHATPTARERDRLRQEVLENLGWRFHRIWSTDWFRNREEAAARAYAAWRQAVELADKADAGQQAAQSSTMDPPPSAIPAASVQPGRTGPCPISISPGESITEYSPADLASLARWIMSDTLLRTDDELMAEMRQVLGFKRDGSRIKAALQDAIAAARRQ